MLKFVSHETQKPSPQQLNHIFSLVGTNNLPHPEILINNPDCVGQTAGPDRIHDISD